MVEILRTTTSICPECMEPIKAEIYIDETKGDNGWVMMRKTCQKHGDFMDKISINPEFYKWKNGYSDILDSRCESAPINIEKNGEKKGCPYDCGLCTHHKSAPNFLIMDITNRCNLNCPICFANANAVGRIMEYSYEECVRIMEYFVKQRPYFAPMAQFSGGEPSLHPRIVDLIRKSVELGFPHNMLNTNGIRMAKDLQFCRDLKDAGLKAVYLSFDGLQPETYKKIRGLDLIKIKKKVITNCREVGLTGVMLVTTVVKGVNDHEVQDILEYARDNNDIIAGVVFQPVSLCGRIGMEDLMKLRYTNSDLIKEIATFSEGKISKFYPLAMTNKLTRLLAWFNDIPQWAITAHDDCGFATLAPIDENNNWKPMEDYADVEGLVKWANEVYDMVMKREIPRPSKILESDFGKGMQDISEKLGFRKAFDALAAFNDKMSDVAYRQAMKTYFIAGAAKYAKMPNPKDLIGDKFYKNVVELVLDPSLRTSKNMLLNKLMFIGSMHFQDAYDMDIERVSRCVVQYGVLDPKDPQKVLQIPFCTYNTIHREGIEKQWAEIRSKALDKTPEQHAKEVQELSDSISNEE